MKLIGITQRVEITQQYKERRDCLDQRWYDLTRELGYLPVPLPNCQPEFATNLVQELSLDALILSGGNSVIIESQPITEDAAPERDAFENALINVANEMSIPLLGVCRGFQMMNLHFGGSLSVVKDHVATRHLVSSESSVYALPDTVNSYHNFGITRTDLAHELEVIAFASDGTIEAARHRSSPILGIMWHPEREDPFNPQDLTLIDKFLQ